VFQHLLKVDLIMKGQNDIGNDKVYTRPGRPIGLLFCVCSALLSHLLRDYWCIYIMKMIESLYS